MFNKDEVIVFNTLLASNRVVTSVKYFNINTNTTKLKAIYAAENISPYILPRCCHISYQG